MTGRSWSGSRTTAAQGLSLESLVNAAQPTLPPAKNALLRVTVTVSSKWGRSVTFALGELDPSFGNHPAYLALQQDRQPLPAPELVVPGDTDPTRTLDAVDRITVAVQNPTPTIPPAPGAVTIEDGAHTRVLNSTDLTALPARTLNVTFEAGTATQQHVETGPTLQEVLRAAHIRPSLNTWVAAVGSDGYVATVTPAEAWVGGRPLLISLNEDDTALTEPRLVVDGDVKGRALRLRHRRPRDRPEPAVRAEMGEAIGSIAHVATGAPDSRTLSREEALAKTVGEVMVRSPKTLPSDAAVADLRRVFDKPNVRTVLLANDGRFAGLIERDRLPADAPDEAPAVTYRDPTPTTATPQIPMLEAIKLLEARDEPRVVVLDEDGITLRGLLCANATSTGFCVR